MFVLVAGLAVLISAWIIILRASWYLSWFIVPSMSILIFFSCITTAIGGILIDCPKQDRQVGWFSGFCLMLSAATLYYLSSRPWYGSLFEMLGSILMMAAMVLAGALCLLPGVRAHFFPSGEILNYRLSRGVCMVLMLATMAVTAYGLMNGWSKYEFTPIADIALANAALALVAVIRKGWLVPALALLLVVLECWLTGSVSIIGKAFNVVFLVGIVAKIAYLCFSLQRDHRHFI